MSSRVSPEETCCVNSAYLLSSAIQTQKENLKDQLSQIFEGPELREHRVPYIAFVHWTWLTPLQYDLRVVLMHDGLYGRSHLYSYVNDNGMWWKTVDRSVTEVSN